MILSNLRARAWQVAAILSAALAVAAVLAWSFSRAGAAASDSRADAAEARAEGLADSLAQTKAALSEERRRAARMTEIAKGYEDERQRAKAVADRTVADLRAGTIRLREEWAGCATARVSEASRSAAELDAAATVREQLAAEIVQIGAEADAQVRGLQAVVESDRNP